MKLHWEALSRPAAELLERAGPLLGRDYVLAGGTGLALQAGHRRSVDLDFFRYGRKLELPKRQRLKDQLGIAGRMTIRSEDEGTLHAVIRNIRVSVLATTAPWVEKPAQAGGVHIASVTDIGLMKLSAVIGRGAKKDFIDLAWILKHQIGLARLLAQLPLKFPDARGMDLVALKALVWFKDAEAEPDPIVLDPAYRWGSVKAYLLGEVKKTRLS